MTTSRWELITTAVLTALLVGGALWGLGTDGVRGWMDSWADAGRSAVLLHVAVLFAVLAAWLGVTTYLGPRSRSAAELQWWHPDSIGDRFVLRYLSLAAVVACVVAWTFVVLPLGLSMSTAGVSVGFVAALALVSALAYLGELFDTKDWLDVGATVLAIAALGLLALSGGDRVTAVLAGCVGLARVGSLLLRAGKARRGDLPPRWLLVRAAQNRWALYAGVLTLDGSVVREVRERWTSRPTGWPHGVSTVGGANVTRVATLTLRQLPALMMTTVVTVYLALSVVDVWSMPSAIAILLLGIGSLGVTAAASSDRWVQARSLRRSYAAVPTWIVMAPSLVSMWLLAVAGGVALRPDLPHLALLATVPPIVAIRRYRSRQSRAAGWATSPMGAIPLEHVDRIVAGWDVTAVALLLIAMA